VAKEIDSSEIPESLNEELDRLSRQHGRALLIAAVKLKYQKPKHRPKGSGIDDTKALEQVTDLVAAGQKSYAAARAVAQKTGGHSIEATARRLYRKFKDDKTWLSKAEARRNAAGKRAESSHGGFRPSGSALPWPTAGSPLYPLQPIDKLLYPSLRWLEMLDGESNRWTLSLRSVLEEWDRDEILRRELVMSRLVEAERRRQDEVNRWLWLDRLARSY